MRCPICGTYMGTLATGVCGVCAEKYSAPPPSEVERLRAENERLENEIGRLIAEAEQMRTALIRLRDCDWTITLPDRMDAVREIARVALAAGGE